MRRAIILLTVGSVICSLFAILAACQKGPEAEEPIKIAYVGGFTGYAAAKAKHLTHGVELAVKEINEAGGVLGRKVEVISYDTRSIPEEAVSAVRKGIYDDKVSGITGFDDASQALAALPVAIKAGIPICNAMSIHKDLVRKPGELGFWGITPQNDQYIKAQCAFAEDILGIKSVVALGPEVAWLHDCYSHIREIWDRPGSPVKVLDTIAYPMGTADLSPIVLRAVGYKPDMIWSFDWSVVGTIQVYKLLADLGYEGENMQCLGNLSQPVIEGAGKTCEGSWSIFCWDVALNNPESIAFKEALVNAFGPQVMNEVSDVTPFGYIAVKSMCMAFEKVGNTTDLEAIDKALFELDWVTPAGWKWHLDEKGWMDWRALHICTVKNGKLQVVAAIPKYR